MTYELFKVSKMTTMFFDLFKEIKMKNKEKYDALTIEDEKIIQKKWREWYSNLSDEKKNVIRNTSKERYYKNLNAF